MNEQEVLQTQNINNTNDSQKEVLQTQYINNTNDSQKKYRLGTVSKNIFLEGLNRFHGRQPHP